MMASKGRRIYSDCNYASNPFHECTEYCLRKIAEGNGKKDKKKSGNSIWGLRCVIWIYLLKITAIQDFSVFYSPPSLQFFLSLLCFELLKQIICFIYVSIYLFLCHPWKISASITGMFIDFRSNVLFKVFSMSGEWSVKA